ncbi:nuclear transport factor 2 family protein [Aureimonas leprariae]|uniref:Nuclear transport factor 2 family protein n=1 Tax=Plantimonas leprariae TaxID=2615207 RepID=A0A7V7PK24_9HYPH|nr:nuclear transport factor 2 family protein [Aureimonas leprariae]KAB0675668.1 nuclear transport factor 2 family protein [Aureimonas leprariae]
MSLASAPTRLASPCRAALLAIALASAALPAAARTPPSTGPIEQRNQAAVRDAFTAWEAGTGAIASLLASDVVWTIQGSGPIAGTYRGRDAFVERASKPLVSRLATPLVPKVHNVWAVDDRVIVRFDASATTTGGHRYSNQYVWIMKMRDGSVAEAEAFLDLVAYQKVVDENEPKPKG